MQAEREYRSLPLWLAREYLVELGGIASEDVVGNDQWHARLRTLEPVPIGALRIGRIQIDFAGEEATLSALLTAFEQKALRAGG